MPTWQQMTFVTVVAAVIVAAAPGLAQTQPAYPVRPVRIVVPSSAGGTQDTLARLLAPRLSESFKQPETSMS